MKLNLTKNFMTNNDCYKTGRTITPKGIMVHSTATPGVMASDWYARWNKPGVAKCVHAFVDDTGVWQYLPWNHRGWHAGGKANDTHIGFEICEPAGFTYVGGATMQGYNADAQKRYFYAAWRNAVELAAMLCKQYGLTANDIICHSEGRRLGIASNHADVMHWFPKHGESMDSFRAAVRAAMADPLPSGTDALTHTVVRGDSLSRLGKVYGVPWKDIAAINGITAPLYIIHPGQVLTIRRAPDEPIRHTVAKGESLSRIGKLYGVGWQIIAADNGIVSPYTIHPGQVLAIRKS